MNTIATTAMIIVHNVKERQPMPPFLLSEKLASIAFDRSAVDSFCLRLIAGKSMFSKGTDLSGDRIGDLL
jgi:hypothetical protein